MQRLVRIQETDHSSFPTDSDEFFADAVTEWGLPAVKDGHSIPPSTRPSDSPSPSNPALPEPSNPDWEDEFNESRARLSELLAGVSTLEMLHHHPISVSESMPPMPISSDPSISVIHHNIFTLQNEREIELPRSGGSTSRPRSMHAPADADYATHSHWDDRQSLADHERFFIELGRVTSSDFRQELVASTV